MCGLLEIGLRGVIFAHFFADGRKDALFLPPRKKLLEWSYPRNWGSFVWNEEGRSEYTLSPYLFPWLAA
jgi:hypothetical protein